MSGRLFNEKQVFEILKRASAAKSGDPDGISLEELKQVGAELGFDPQQIEVAAQSVGSETRANSGILGARLFLDQTVEGEISPDVWAGMVAVLQRYFKKPGTATERGSAYDWICSDDQSSMALNVKVRNGQTLIRLESNNWMGPLFAFVFVPVFTMVFSLSAFKHGYTWQILGIFTIGAGLLFGLTKLLRTHHLQTVIGLMDRLIDETQSATPGRSIESMRALSDESVVDQRATS